MPKTQVSIKGLEELESALLRLPPKLARSVATSALREGGKVIATRAQQNLAPAGIRRITGSLFNGIGVRAANSRSRNPEGFAAKVQVGILTGKGVGGRNPYYARFLEEGTNAGISARGFMRDAVNSTERQVIAATGKKARERLKKLKVL